MPEKENIFAYRIDQHNIFKNNNESLKWFRDSRRFQENALLSSKTVALIRYHDNVNVVNLLGKKTVKYKTSAFYFILGKLPWKSRPKLFDINLILLSSAQIASKHGYEKNIQTLLDDFKK